MKGLRSLVWLFCWMVGSLAADEPLRVALSCVEEEAETAVVWEDFLRREGLVVERIGERPGRDEVEGAGVVLWVGRREGVPERWGKAMVVVDDFVKAGEEVEVVRRLWGAATAEAKDWRGKVPLFFTPAGMESPLGKRIANFEVESGFEWGQVCDPEIRVLATTWTPHSKKLRGGAPQPYVYGVTPVWWVLERDGVRVAGVNLRGEEILKHPAVRVMLLRSLAWAGGKEALDSYAEPDELAALAYPPDGPLEPVAALSALKVHPEFEIDLVAAEPVVSKPLNLDWDARGRLWVAESLEYPEGTRGGGPESMFTHWQRESELKKPDAVSRPGRDRISWLEDTDGDGRMDRRHVFADQLDLVTSFCFYRDGVIVAQAPEVLWLRDSDGDGKADKRVVLYKGLGTFDTHAVLNNLRWGLDGWIYATHGYSSSPKVTSGDGLKDFGPVNSGVVRFRPDGSAFEMRTAKSGNCWGVEVTSEGEVFFTQPTSGDLVMHAPVSDRMMAEGSMGREPSWKVLVHMRPVKPMMSQEEIIEHQPNDVIGSFTAACGCAVYEGGSWPGLWTRGYFTCEPTVHLVHHEKLEEKGVSFEASKTREEEFSATRDFWHRPIDTRVGLDGNLYVTDFYNQAILHNDPRGPIHLWNHQAARPDRDHYLGRIYRYRHRGAKELPKVDLLTTRGKIEALGHPNREIRFKAQRLIEEDPAVLKQVAAELGEAEGWTRLHALWLRAAAGVLTEVEMVEALTDRDEMVRLTISRVLEEHPVLVSERVMEAVARQLEVERHLRVRLMLLAAVPVERSLPAGLLVGLETGGDAWIRAAVLRNALRQPERVWGEMFEGKGDLKDAGYLAEALLARSRSDAEVLGAMLAVMEGADRNHEEVVVASLQALGAEAFAVNEAVKVGLKRFLERDSAEIVAAALPLAAQVSTKEERAKWLPEVERRVLAYAEEATTGEDERLGVYVALARLPEFSDQVKVAIRGRVGEGKVLDALCANRHSGAVEVLIASLKSISTESRAKVVEVLLGRKDSALELLKVLDSGELSLAVGGPSVLSRLEEHPEREVGERAKEVAKKLRGAMEARDATIARLLPEVSQPGDIEAGRSLYGACAVCHLFRGQGVSMGPVLDGIGIHSTEVLLTHIIDPNREVEPSYHAWTVTLKDGEVVSGMVSRETATSLYLRNVAGEIEIPREKIVAQTNRGVSLMPEGFENLGPEALRNLIAYLQSGSQRYHAIPLGRAATADGRRGVYLGREVEGDRVWIRKYGLVKVGEVPFSLPDPAGLASGRNVIVLKGGAEEGALSQRMPQEVEVPVNQVAGRIHLLGGVAGWGWPVDGDKVAVMVLTVHYRGGEEEVIELRNGIEFADHAGAVEVTGSAATDLVERGQLRYLWRDLKGVGKVVERVVLRSTARLSAPMLAAITMEAPDAEGKMGAAPAQGGPVAAAGGHELPGVKPEGKVRVLMVGGGSSHDFERWYHQEDRSLLEGSGDCVVAYVTTPEEAIREIGKAEVVLLSSNDAAFGESEGFRKAMGEFAKRGGGLVLLHPATWYNWSQWPEYHDEYVGGGARGHDPLGEFGIEVRVADHPVMEGVAAEFRLKDELYAVELRPGREVQVLAETSADRGGVKRPSVWVPAHETARIVCIAPGHDGEAHLHPEFRRLLTNAVLWSAGAPVRSFPSGKP